MGVGGCVFCLFDLLFNWEGIHTTRGAGIRLTLFYLQNSNLIPNIHSHHQILFPFEKLLNYFSLNDILSSDDARGMIPARLVMSIYIIATHSSSSY